MCDLFSLFIEDLICKSTRCVLCYWYEFSERIFFYI